MQSDRPDDAGRCLASPPMVFFMFAVNVGPMSPHQGRSPLALAGFTATALAGAERQLSEELSGPVGRLIPAPLDAAYRP